MIAPSADGVVRSMSEEFLSGTPAPGDKLPSERELAARFGVGRPLIREALRSLAELGLIETIPARGTFVRAGGDTRADRQAGMAIRRRGVTAHELSEARLMLETGTARRAAQRATADDIARLEAILEGLDRSSGTDHVERDLAFHLEIACGSTQPGRRDDAGVDRRAHGSADVPQRRRPAMSWTAASATTASRSMPSGRVTRMQRLRPSGRT